MKRTIGKLITLLLCLTMILSLMPVTALAATPDLGELGSIGDITNIPGVDSDNIGDIIDELGKLPSAVATPTPDDPKGTCGESITWHLSLSTGVLTVSGSGAMPNFDANGAPWYSYRGKIKSVVMDEGITTIGDYAFDGLANMTAISMSDGITSIGKNAFYDCGKLTAIDLPDGLTEIGVSAFCNCKALTAVTLPDSITKIGNQAFRYCNGLTSVALPAGITAVPSAVFANCDSLKEVVLHDRITKIGSYAFDSCTALTDVVLPESLTLIGQSAFSGCAALTAIDIPDSVTAIDMDAFSGSALEYLALPDGIEAIDGVVYNCYALKAVYLPKSIVEITELTFNSCSALTDVYYGGSKLDWKDIIIGENNDELLNAAFHYNASGLPEDMETVNPTPTPVATPAPTAAPTPTVAPTTTPEPTTAPTPTVESTVKPVTTPNPNMPNGKCGENATWEFNTSTGTLTISGEGEMFESFGTEDDNAPWYSYRNKITTVVVEPGITSLSFCSFYNLQRLKNVSLPEGLTKIGTSAFNNCQALESVTIPGTVTELGSAVFSDCASLKEIRIPDSVTKMGEMVFFNCTALKSVVLSKNITELPFNAFNTCTSLTDIRLHDGLKTIGDSAFSNCSALKEIYIPETVTDISFHAFSTCRALETVAIPEGVTILSRGTFSNCHELKSVSLPKSLVEVEQEAFLDCHKLSDVNYEGSEADWNDVIIAKSNMDGSANILLTSKVTIHYNSYKPSQPVITPTPTAAPTPVITPTPTVEPTPTVKPVTTPNPNLPNGKCGANATWEFNTADGTLTIRGEGKMVNGYKTEAGTVVGYGWNKYQSVIKKVVIEEGITHISDNAFKECTGLKEVVMPESVTSIGDMVFWGTWNVEKFTIHPTLAETYYNSVPPYIENLYIYDLEHFLGLYQGKTSAGEYTGNFFTDAKNIYLNDVLLTDLVIPEGFTSVPDSAFSGCNSLKTVTLPDTVTTIGEKAFFECDNLKDVKLSENLKEIEQQAFDSCKSLTSITIPASVEIINERVFSNVKSIAFEGNAPLIAANAFMQVKADAYYPAGNSTWTAEKKENYGGELNWVEGTPTVEPTTTPEVTPTVAPTTTPEPTKQPGDFEYSNACGENAIWSYDEATATLTISGTGPMAEGARSENGILVSYSWYKYESEIKTVVVEDGITHISDNAFKDFTALTKVTLPKSIASIGFNVFLSCDKLTEIHYGGSESDWNAIEINTKGNDLLNTVAIVYAVAPTTTPEVTPSVKPTVTPAPTQAPIATPSPNPNLDPETCKHTLFFVAPQDATCTEEGFTGKIICGKGCGHVLQEGRVKPALGHKYKNGSCTRCGHIEGEPEPTPTPPTAGDTPFTDMTANDWFYEAVRWAVAEGITSGTSENTFSPDGVCTRAQIVTFLWAAAGKPEPTSKSPFTDVKEGDWYYDPVIWAVENDITSGTTETTFSPDIPCSRAQVVALLYKAMGAPEVNTADSPFTDVSESNYYYKAVLWALENGVASGMTAELFGSSQPCTRAQIATFLYKAYNK